MVSAACGGDAPSESGDLPSWSLGEPTLRLGTPDGGPTAFSRVGSVALGPEARLHVLLPQDFQVRVFDQDGTFVGSIGSEGDGPGEFRRPGRLGFVGDTLWVLDDGVRRASFFLNGAFVRSESYPPLEGLHEERLGSVESVLEGSSLLVATDVRSPFQPEVTSRPGILFNATGGRFDSLSTIGVDHVGGYMIKGSPPDIEAVAVFQQPFSAASLWAVSETGATIAIVDQIEQDSGRGAYSVTVLSTSGTVSSTRVHEYAPVAIPTRYVDSLLTPYATEPFSLRDVREAAYVPSAFPPVSGVLVAGDEEVWLALEDVPHTEQRWRVLGVGGEPVATLVAPVGFSVLIVDGLEVWGLIRDDFDVPYLERRPIVQ